MFPNQHISRWQKEETNDTHVVSKKLLTSQKNKLNWTKQYFRGYKLTSTPGWNIHILRYKFGKIWLSDSIYLKKKTSFAVYTPWANTVPTVTLKATVTLECLSRSKVSSIKTTAVLWSGLGIPHLKRLHSFPSPTFRGVHSWSGTARMVSWPETVISAEQMKSLWGTTQWKRKLRHGWRHAGLSSNMLRAVLRKKDLKCSVELEGVKVNE